MSEAASLVQSYFEAKWYRENKPADQALAEAKEAAIRGLQAKIDAISALSFSQFKTRCLHESVQPDSVHPVEGEHG